jgi:hypothetical protein
MERRASYLIMPKSGSAGDRVRSAMKIVVTVEKLERFAA